MSGLAPEAELALEVELASGAEAQAACPETTGHRRSPQVSDLDIPSRKVCQPRALMDRWRPRWGSGWPRTNLVLLPGLRLVQVEGAVLDHCLVVPAHYETPVGFSGAVVERDSKLLARLVVYMAGEYSNSPGAGYL